MPGWTGCATISRFSALPLATTKTQLAFPSVFTAVGGDEQPAALAEAAEVAVDERAGRASPSAATTSASTSMVRVAGSTTALFTRTFAWKRRPPGVVTPSTIWPDRDGRLERLRHREPDLEVVHVGEGDDGRDRHERHRVAGVPELGR